MRVNQLRDAFFFLCLILGLWEIFSGILCDAVLMLRNIIAYAIFSWVAMLVEKWMRAKKNINDRDDVIRRDA